MCDTESRLYLGDSARVISGPCREAVWGHSGLSEKLGVFPRIGKDLMAEKQLRLPSASCYTCQCYDSD